MTRATYRVISKAANWNCTVVLDDNAKKELIWWIVNIDEVSGFTMNSSPTVSLLHFKHILHGDASGVGMYLGMIRNQAVTLVSESFTEAEASKSSTYREVSVLALLY